MYFKDKKYYIEKAKYYLGIAATAILFDIVLILGVLYA